MSRLAELRSKKKEIASTLSTSNSNISSNSNDTEDTLMNLNEPQLSNDSVQTKEIQLESSSNKFSQERTSSTMISTTPMPQNSQISKISQNSNPSLNSSVSQISKSTTSNDSSISKLDILRQKKVVLSQKSTELLSSSDSNPMIILLQKQVQTLKEQLKEMEMQIESMQLERDIAIEELEIMKETIQDDAHTFSDSSHIVLLENEVTKLRDEKIVLKESLNNLNERLDLLSTSENMIETISNRNLILEEKLKQYENQVNDLKELVEMGEEIEAIHQSDLELLRDDLKAKEYIILQMKKDLENYKKEVSEKEQLIEKYKDRLNNESNILQSNLNVEEKIILKSQDNSELEKMYRLYKTLDVTKILKSYASIQVNHLENLVSQISEFIPSNIDNIEIVNTITTSNLFKYSEKKFESLIIHILDIVKRNESSEFKNNINESLNLASNGSLLRNSECISQFIIAISILRFITMHVNQRIDFCSGEEFQNIYQIINDLVLVFDHGIENLTTKINEIEISSVHHLIYDRLAKYLIDIAIETQKKVNLDLSDKITIKVYNQICEILLHSININQDSNQKLLNQIENIDINLEPKNIDELHNILYSFKEIDNLFTDLLRLVRRHIKYLSSFSQQSLIPTIAFNWIVQLKIMIDYFLNEHLIFSKINQLIKSAIEENDYYEVIQILQKINNEFYSNDISQFVDSSNRFHSISLWEMITKVLSFIFYNDFEVSIKFEFNEKNDIKSKFKLFISYIEDWNQKILPVINQFEKDPNNFSSFSEYSKIEFLKNIKNQIISIPDLQLSIYSKDTKISLLNEKLIESKNQISKLELDKLNLEQKINSITDSQQISSLDKINQRKDLLQDGFNSKIELEKKQELILQLNEQLNSNNILIENMKEEYIKLESLHKKLENKVIELMMNDEKNRNLYFSLKKEYNNLFQIHMKSLNIQISEKMRDISFHLRKTQLKERFRRTIRLKDIQIQSQNFEHLQICASKSIVDLSNLKSFNNGIEEILSSKNRLNNLISSTFLNDIHDNIQKC